MTDEPDWRDPFAEDPAAVERERRRAEREARRREQRRSVAEKVQLDPGGGPAATPPGEEADGDARPGPATERAAADEPPRDAAHDPVTEPATADHDVEPPAPGMRRAATGDAATRGRSRGPSAAAMRNRRIAGAVLFVALLGVVGFGAVKVVERLGDDGPPPAPAPKPKPVENVLIPEGLDRHQIADTAKKAGLKGDYEKQSRSFKGFDPKKYGAEDAPNLEGFLFPATYEVPKHGTVKDLISRQLDAFRANIADVDMSYAKSKNLTTYDVLKIASMIEREVQVAKERPLVAEVIYNRLKSGTPLGIDATIRYYLGNYDEQLTESELADPEPYNTRINTGLPPTPISNPGLDSIKAAANPTKGDLLFFVVKPGTCGHHVFTSSEAEFEQAQAAYQQALAEQGGSPTDC